MNLSLKELSAYFLITTLVLLWVIYWILQVIDQYYIDKAFSEATSYIYK